MLVGFDATTIRGNKSGVGYYTSRLVEHLTAEGGASNPIDELLVLSNRHIELPNVPRCRVVSEGRFPLRAIWMQAVLPRVLGRLRPDICHYTNFLGPYFSNVPYVVTFHDMTLQLLPSFHTWKKRLLTRPLAPAIARNAKFIITPSESARRDVARLFDLDRARIRAIPHAADAQFRPRRDDESIDRIERRYGVRRPYLLYVGTLEPRKNLARAAAAFSRIAHRFPDHHFYLAGDVGWKSQTLFRTLAQLPHRERVKRLGYVAEEDLAALYSNAALFVYPSLYEGFGFPVIEAMACGVPVLTSDNSSLAEIARGAALLCDPYDLSAITAAMERGLEDERERERVRLAGMTRASSFSWEESARQTLAVYEEALERSNVRPLTPRPSFSLDGREAKAVIDTIAYSALFDYPMTLPEIHRSLLGVSQSRRQLSRLLAHHPLVRENIDVEPPYHFLKGQRATVQARLEANRRTRKLLERERFAIDVARRCPFVRMVAFSGATAHDNARDEDIDLFVVTSQGRTWAVALLLHVAMKLLRRRKTICLNYFIGEDKLALSEQDAFTASQIVSLKPLAGRGVLYRIVRANSWGARFFPNYWREFRSLVPSEHEPPVGSLLLETALSLGGGFVCERLGRFFLGAYLRRREGNTVNGSSVKLEPGVLKLHFKDHGAELNRELETLRPKASDPNKSYSEIPHVGSA